MERDDQRRAILRATGHLLIEGGPGSGKTTIALLKASRRAQTLEAEQRILFLSFSRAAVQQVSDRMVGLIDRGDRARIEIRTFHSFFLDLVRSHAHLITGKRSSMIAPDREPALRAEFDGDWRTETLRLAVSEGRFVFDRLADAAASILERRLTVQTLYANVYPMIIVDEFQDTNTAQWRAIHALSRQATIVCLADPDQRIFGYLENVDEERLQEATQQLAPITRFDLSADNHRGSNGLLAYANAVLRAAPCTLPDEITAVPYAWPLTAELRTHHAVVALRNHLTGTLGYNPTIAVLARTNTLIGAISDTISTARTGTAGLLPAIEHELSFDAALAAASAVVIASVLEWPAQPMHEAVIGTLRAVADFFRTKQDRPRGAEGARARVATIEKAITALEKGRPPRAKAAKCLVAAFEAGVAYAGDSVGDWRQASSLLTEADELVEIAKQARYVRLLKATDALAWALADVWDGERSYPDATAVVREVLAAEALDGTPRPPARVNLMNMHKSKGKEFDGVVVTEGNYNGRLLPADGAAHELRDARRLLRVAITRARHHVVLVRPADAPDLTRPTAPER